LSLKDKVSIVTGGGRGIGKAISIRLSNEGSKIVIIYNHDSVSAKETLREIVKSGGDGIVMKADVSSPVEVRQAVNATIENFGKINVLVNNAGIFILKSFLELTEEIWEATLNTNLKGIFLFSQLVAKQMIKQKISGSIINIGSTAGGVGLKNMSHYCASKGGVILLTKAMALELAPYNIRVNAVSPGTILAGPSLEGLENEEFRNEHLKLFPLGRFGESEEVAGVVAFLISGDAGWITGQNIFVDGGLLATR
jgi:NAD(P)-dependent dehydrogenase (short-subunit alcohol dehydrogenase family)